MKYGEVMKVKKLVVALGFVVFNMALANNIENVDSHDLYPEVKVERKTGKVLSSGEGLSLRVGRSPSQAYKEALEHSDTMKAAAVLNPIAPWNQNLTWKDGRVRVATRVSDHVLKNYLSHLKSGGRYTVTTDSWVTPYPDLQAACKKWSGETKDDLNLRTAQVLGLPRSKPGETFHVMELYVDPKDLIRPCLDSEIYDTTCVPPYFPNVPERVKQWRGKENDYFDKSELKALEGIYNDTHAEGYLHYPFTGVGYTYDWNPQSKTNIGLTEYVLNNGATTQVVGIYPLVEYCSES